MVHQHSLKYNGDPFPIFALFKDEPHVFFLDSSLQGADGRFSYIGFDPFAIVQGHDLGALKKAFDKHRLRSHPLTFPAGAVGYLGYDGSLFFGLYDTVLTIDHLQKKLVISGFSKVRIKDILIQLKASPQNPVSTSSTPGVAEVSFKSNFTKTGYLKAVRQALEHIRRGDIYQINLSHQVKVDVHWKKYAEPSSIYQQLRQLSPSGFGAYFNDGRQIILSASPERFLCLRNGKALVKPMKGTRPRGRSKAQDQKLKLELIKSPKEIAELLMVTDLERNDLGRVCEYSSIKVSSMRDIETYATVFQATSTVEGRLRRDCDAFDLLQATFPSGSVTGCPKIEAMKNIKQIEHGSRYLYTGALGYISFTGNMDFNVMIRTMFLKPRQITFHVGGGIVADSKPLAEWQETWAKAKPLMETLKRCLV